MSTNAIGTIFRIIGIFLSLIIFWYGTITLIYFIFCLIINVKFDFNLSFLLFGIFIVFRAFYPKNVFR